MASSVDVGFGGTLNTFVNFSPVVGESLSVAGEFKARQINTGELGCVLKGVHVWTRFPSVGVNLVAGSAYQLLVYTAKQPFVSGNLPSLTSRGAVRDLGLEELIYSGARFNSAPVDLVWSDGKRIGGNLYLTVLVTTSVDAGGVIQATCVDLSVVGDFVYPAGNGPKLR